MQKHINRPQIAPFIRQSTHIDFLNHFDNIQVQNEKDTDFNVSKTGLIDKSKLYSFEKNQIGPQPGSSHVSDVHLHFHLKVRQH